ncbi:hypothetical protein E2P81_ATG08027 [Venturia nashicola]|nr:hypothetical protein E2P81_ATG08027 [Venturia nashicola]
MVLGVVSPDFIKPSVSQPLRAPASDRQKDAQNPPKTDSLSSTSISKVPMGQVVIPKHRNFSKPFYTAISAGSGSGSGRRRTQSEILSTSLPSSTQPWDNQNSKNYAEVETQIATISSPLGDQNHDGIHKIDPSRRVKSCSLPQAQTRVSGEEEREVSEEVRTRSTSLGERLKIDDRARTWGGVPSTEMTVSGRTFWRSVLGSSAREREKGEDGSV